MDFVVIQKHCGQYKSYGDFFRVWEIKTDAEKQDVLDYCFANVYRRPVPESGEWHRNIRYGTGEKSGDANYYFAGYYTLAKIEGGWTFTVCEPYTD
jgi:hypothetical protein